MTHNGGRIQICPNFLQTGGEFPFIDHLKTGQQWSQVTDGNPPIPSNLDASTGFPVSGPGVYTIVYIPSQTDRPGNWIVDWLGDMTTLRRGFGATTVSGATSGVNGQWKFTPTDAPDSTYGSIRLDIGVSAYNASNPITQLRVYHEDDAIRIANGEIFNPIFVSRLQEAKVGTIRFLNWVSGNTCLAPKWAYRKPTTYAYYNDAHFIPSRDAGSAGGTSSALTCTYPNSESLTDKIVVHLLATNGVTSGATLNSIQMKDASGAANFSNSSGRLCTCIYDQDLNVWICTDGGLRAGVPPETMTQLCNLISAHCWTHIPYLALDNPANWATPLAQHLQTNLSSGLLAFYECNNEVWNTFSGFSGTNYGNAKSTVLFPSQNIHDWYGMVCSTNGQAVSAVYGNDRTKYEFVCGVQSATFNTVSGSDRRLDSTQWVALGGGRTAAKNWVTGVCVTTYINSLCSLTHEIDLAVQWQTATATQKQALYLDYWSTNTAEDLSALPSTNSLYTSYQTWLSWAQGKGVNKLFAYEGGNSQDYPSTLSDDNCTITNIVSSGAQTIVTLSSSTTHPKAGMWAAFNGVVGMTQINSVQGLIASVVGDTVTVNIDSSGFSAFSATGSPRLRPYLALPITGITKAGSAVITTDGTAGRTPYGGYFCYVVGVSGMTQINGQNAKVTYVDNVTASFNVNSTGFSTYTSGGYLLVPSVGVRRDFRDGSRTFYRLYSIETTNMKYFLQAGGLYPSLFNIGGASNVWSALQPTVYNNDAQKWDAFRLFSNRKRRFHILT